jgi:hypothetical protein
MRSFKAMSESRRGLKLSIEQLDDLITTRHEAIAKLVAKARIYMRAHQEELARVLELSAQSCQACQKAAADAGQAALVKLGSAEERLAQEWGPWSSRQEAYPDWMGNPGKERLDQDVASAQKNLAMCKAAYNDQARLDHALTRRFPGRLVARLAGFQTVQTLV